MALVLVSAPGANWSGKILVYMRSATTVGAMGDAVAFAAELATYEKVGECKKGVKMSLEAGETFEGNEYGKRVRTKNGKVEAFLSYMSIANITALEAIDGESVDVLLVNNTDEIYMLLAAKTFNYTEAYEGAGDQGIPLLFEDEVSKASDFRTIAAIPQV